MRRPSAARSARATHGVQAGFTLLECLVVLGIAAVLVGAGALSVPQALAELRLRAATTQLGGILARARAASLAEGRSWELRIVTERAFEAGPVGAHAVRYALMGGVGFAGATSGGSVRFSPLQTAENATFTLASGERLRRVVVNQRGRIHVE